MKLRSVVLAAAATVVVAAVPAVPAVAARSRVRRCETEISFTTYGPKLTLDVTAKNVSCSGAKRLAARAASTRGQWTPSDRWTCSVQFGPTEGECVNRRNRTKSFSWQLKR